MQCKHIHRFLFRLIGNVNGAVQTIVTDFMTLLIINFENAAPSRFRSSAHGDYRFDGQHVVTASLAKIVAMELVKF